MRRVPSIEERTSLSRTDAGGRFEEVNRRLRGRLVEIEAQRRTNDVRPGGNRILSVEPYGRGDGKLLLRVSGGTGGWHFDVSREDMAALLDGGTVEPEPYVRIRLRTPE